MISISRNAGSDTLSSLLVVVAVPDARWFGRPAQGFLARTHYRSFFSALWIILKSLLSLLFILDSWSSLSAHHTVVQSFNTSLSPLPEKNDHPQFLSPIPSTSFCGACGIPNTLNVQVPSTMSTPIFPPLVHRCLYKFLCRRLILILRFHSVRCDTMTSTAQDRISAHEERMVAVRAVHPSTLSLPWGSRYKPLDEGMTPVSAVSGTIGLIH